MAEQTPTNKNKPPPPPSHEYTSGPMLEVMREADLFAQHDISILLTGENGTGKELVASRIHNHPENPRRGKSFIAVDCSTIPRELVASELFGHEKGSFTGAHERRIGKFEQANGGTIFLDEIGDMPPELQPALLRALAVGKVTRVGGTEEITASPRVISATNKDLVGAINDKKFREDLYYRLRGNEIKLPPLREHGTDIPMLAQHFANVTADREGIIRPGFSESSITALKRYSWPGNIRELQQVIGQATIRSKLNPDHMITSDMLKLETGKFTATPTTLSAIPVEETFGYKLYLAREKRRWQRQDLIREVNSRSSTEFTIDHVKQWEANTAVPDHDVVNTLAYLLIVNIGGPTEERIKALDDFFDAADTTRKAINAHQEIPKETGLGDILSRLRKRANLTHTDLVRKILKMSKQVMFEDRELYLIETGNHGYRITPEKTLALVKALDTQEHPLSSEEKLDLYTSAKEIFTASHQTLDTAYTPEENMKNIRAAYIELFKRPELKAIIPQYFKRDKPTIRMLSEAIGINRNRLSPLLISDYNGVPTHGTTIQVAAYLRGLESKGLPADITLKADALADDLKSVLKTLNGRQ